MNAIQELYTNVGLVTEDGYVKVRDGLWVASGPYEEQSWHDADKSTLPNEAEYKEILLELRKLILIQESCRLPSLQQTLVFGYPWIWNSTECEGVSRVSDGWTVPIRRTP